MNPLIIVSKAYIQNLSPLLTFFDVKKFVVDGGGLVGVKVNLSENLRTKLNNIFMNRNF